MSDKSILEQALLQVQTLEEAVKANAKGILASTMKQELNDLLKESLEEEKEVEEQPDSEEDTDDVPVVTGDDENPDNEGDEPSKDIDSLDSDDDMGPSMDDMDSDDDMGPSMDDMDSDDDMGPSMDDMDSDDEDVLDMTNADEDEILKVFKAMGPNDGVIVKKDDNHIELSDGDDEYIIQLDEEDMMSDEMPVDEDEMMSDEMPMDEEDMMSDEMPMDEEDMMSDEMPMDEEDMMSDETVYEIELDDVDEVDTTEGDVEPVEGDVDESARTMGFGYHGGLKSKNVYKAGNKREEINEEVSKLKKQNDEYKKALVLFKEKLNEVAVFNANLAYATRLFTEHSTTKQEKLNILKRFDSISTLKESKNLYSSIKTELNTKKPVTESVVEKINQTPTSSSTNVLSESKAYENPQFKRMKDLMSKIK
jgi:hypothetical protein